jgi:hypothetical protein
VGGDAWVTPIAVIPFAIVYALYDRTLARKEEAGELH